MRATHTLVVDQSQLSQGLVLRRPAVMLKVIRGLNRRRQLRSEALRITIGAVGADLILEDPSVSAIHCELCWGERGLVLRNLGSKNGVWFQRRCVEEMVLESGDVFELGASAIKVELVGDVETALQPHTHFGQLIGSSVAMCRLYDMLARLAATDVSVLLQGETGTGKELAAQALIDHSSRKRGPIVIFDCAAASPNLIESELFGHEQGAFTGATRTVAGVFERAHGGTLVLDSVCELPLELQSRLLGALERGVVQRLGGSRAIEVDVRVIALSQTPLEELVNQGRFRSDLYYRLAAVQVMLPPLRERMEDIPQLVAHFLENLGRPSLSPAVLERLFRGNYVGNVRQLRSAVEQAVLGLTLSVPQASRSEGEVDIQRPLLMQRDALAHDFERRYLAAQLSACGNNVSEAARRSGIDRMHLHRLLQKHQLLPARKGPGV